MPLDNSLNVSELLRRLGVKGDSLGSAPLLESLRMSLQIGDLSQLVAPLRGPLGAATLVRTSGVGTVNNWFLQCLAPGGVTVLEINNRTSSNFRVAVSPVNLFGVSAVSAANNFASGQFVDSVFHAAAAAAALLPNTFWQIHGSGNATMGAMFENWIAPADFLLIEGISTNTTETMTIRWKEYPAALNPG